jgi:hypothetical protein
MSETIVRFKVTFAKARATKATAAPTLAKGRDAPENGACVDSMPLPATRRNVGRAARQLALAHLVDRKVEAGEIKDYAEAARRLGISRARMAQVMALLNLSARLQEAILVGTLPLSERRLRHLSEVDWGAQKDLLEP